MSEVKIFSSSPNSNLISRLSLRELIISAPENVNQIFANILQLQINYLQLSDIISPGIILAIAKKLINSDNPQEKEYGFYLILQLTPTTCMNRELFNAAIYFFENNANISISFINDELQLLLSLYNAPIQQADLTKEITAPEPNEISQIFPIPKDNINIQILDFLNNLQTNPNRSFELFKDVTNDYTDFKNLLTISQSNSDYCKNFACFSLAVHMKSFSPVYFSTYVFKSPECQSYVESLCNSITSQYLPYITNISAPFFPQLVTALINAGEMTHDYRFFILAAVCPDARFRHSLYTQALVTYYVDNREILPELALLGIYLFAISKTPGTERPFHNARYGLPLAQYCQCNDIRSLFKGCVTQNDIISIAPLFFDQNLLAQFRSSDKRDCVMTIVVHNIKDQQGLRSAKDKCTMELLNKMAVTFLQSNDPFFALEAPRLD